MQKHIVVLGGGTAGWLVAARLAAEKITIDEHPVSITLLESSDVPTIGVGEGTWPSMCTTLRKIGLSEIEFLSVCNASLKQGSRFVNWRTGGDEFYDHPFTLPVGMGHAALAKGYVQQSSGEPFSHWSCLQSHIIDAGLAPKQLQTPDYTGVFNYGYHLDAGAFAGLLKRHAVGNLGVHHCLGHFSSARQNAEGFITALQLADGRVIEGDFFVDASGTHNQLIGGVLDSEFISLADVSLNDRALALGIPYVGSDAAILSATLSTAQEAGWIWDIGLQHRRGVGYVYSSAFASDEAALATLNQYAQQINSAVDASDARRLIIKPGYRAQPWVKNCVAIGMASGFIEPLEASALVMVELGASWLCEHLPVNTHELAGVAARYNQLFTERWERIRDFLQLHYHLSQRRDTPYWQLVTEGIPLSDRLAALLQEWRYRDPSLYDFGQYMELFPAASYLYILLGMRPDYPQGAIGRVSDALPFLMQERMANNKKKESYLTYLPSNREYLSQLKNKMNVAI